MVWLDGEPVGSNDSTAPKPDMNEAANALRWCVGEMERRYKMMAALGVRNIASANKKIKEVLGHTQRIPFEEAMTLTESWLRYQRLTP